MAILELFIYPDTIRTTRDYYVGLNGILFPWRGKLDLQITVGELCQGMLLKLLGAPLKAGSD